jgi:hypothetical protein
MSTVGPVQVDIPKWTLHCAHATTERVVVICTFLQNAETCGGHRPRGSPNQRTGGPNVRGFPFFTRCGHNGPWPLTLRLDP